MKVSQAGIDLIREFEGFSAVSYRDVAGKLTIGIGHMIKAGEKFDVITEQQAEAMLYEDLKWAEAAVLQCVDVDITQNQFDALCCFTYNVGGGSLLKSTLLIKLNESDYHAAADQFLRWDHAGGKLVPGLTRRREAERKLFLS